MTTGADTNARTDELTLALKHLVPVLTRIMDMVEDREQPAPEGAELHQNLERIATALEAQTSLMQDLRTGIVQMVDAYQETQTQLDAVSKRMVRETQGRTRLEAKIDNLLTLLTEPA